MTKVKILISENTKEEVELFTSELAACIKKSKRMLVITGAGISCSSGIPVKKVFIVHLSIFFLKKKLKNVGLSVFSRVIQ